MLASARSLASTLSLVQRLLLWQLSLAGGGLAVWAARRRPPGAARLPVAVCVVALNQLWPLAFDGDTEVITNITAFIVACITNVKLLSWVMGRGSLAERALTLPQFVAVYALPITPADAPAAPPPAPPPSGKRSPGTAGMEGEEAEDSQAKGKPRPKPTAEARSALTHFRHFVRKAAALAGVVHVFVRFSAGVPRIALLVLQGFSQYLGVSLGMDAMAAAVGALTGLAIAPAFNNPYASTSLGDFWNHRWNLTVSDALRSGVYEPIMEGRLVRRPGQAAPFSRARRLAAVFAVFVVSGLMHEALFWNFTGRFTPRLLWLKYFAGWGALVVAENTGKHALRGAGLRVPTSLARILTIAIVNLMVVQYWWPPVNEMGVPEKAAQHAVEAWRALRGAAPALRK